MQMSSRTYTKQSWYCNLRFFVYSKFNFVIGFRYIGQWCARRADQKYAEGKLSSISLWFLVTIFEYHLQLLFVKSEGLTPLTSQTPVYLEQDLYCLASSNGSRFVTYIY
jgi:hypothetical protein